MIFFQVNDDNIVVSIGESPKIPKGSNIFETEEYDVNLLGKKYDSETGSIEDSIDKESAR
ncbi:hypothetical protein ACE41H_09765 [Paenibacillus enshidis]|uniref:Uncharacterized protein n=1 Tax=Paenibacillus enshidis TaxID=1458439 RepID=A0ABV5ASR4_9BACL